MFPRFARALPHGKHCFRKQKCFWQHVSLFSQGFIFRERFRLIDKRESNRFPWQRDWLGFSDSEDRLMGKFSEAFVLFLIGQRQSETLRVKTAVGNSSGDVFLVFRFRAALTSATLFLAFRASANNKEFSQAMYFWSSQKTWQKTPTSVASGGSVTCVSSGFSGTVRLSKFAQTANNWNHLHASCEI